MKTRFKWIVLAACLLVMLLFCTGCSDDSYRQTLESGQRKAYSGQPMTKQEYNAVKNFNKWKANQGSKTYDQWNR